MHLLLCRYDFAGQQEYYVTHHIFLTDRALYVLAFDLSKFSPATYDRQIDFWLTSIQNRVPQSKVILVGTHADMIDDAAQVAFKCEKIKNYITMKRRRAMELIEAKLIKYKERREELEGERTKHADQTLKKQTGTLRRDYDQLKEKHNRGSPMSEEQENIVELCVPRLPSFRLVALVYLLEPACKRRTHPDLLPMAVAAVSQVHNVA